jgi:hypothetical protein
LKKLFTVLAGVCLLVGSAFASLVTVDFSVDTLGPKANGWQSASSSLISFNDTIGSDLLLFSGTETLGQNGLASLTDFDQSGLELVSSVQIFALSMNFGNDTGAGNAILTAFNGASQVASTTVAFNGNGLVDQSISVAFAGGFNRAVLVYDNGTPGGRSELINNVQFETVPEPMTMTVLALGAMAAHRRRQKKA